MASKVLDVSLQPSMQKECCKAEPEHTVYPGQLQSGNYGVDNHSNFHESTQKPDEAENKRFRIDH